VSGLHVDEDGARPDRHHGVGGSDEAVADSGHVVAWPHARHPQAKLQRSRAVGHRHGKRGAHRRGKLALERRHLRALRHPARADDPTGCLDLGVAERQSNNGNLHGPRIGPRKVGRKFLDRRLRYTYRYGNLVWMKRTLNIDDRLLAEAKVASGAITDTDTIRLGLGLISFRGQVG